MQIVSQSLAETKRVAEELLNNIQPRETATVLALEGDLGSGKTTFTQHVGEILGVGENMHSPTFVIMKVYQLTGRHGVSTTPFDRLIHIDAYRLESESELLHLGWGEIIKEKGNLILIEWPERVRGIIPDDAQWIHFQFIDESTRQIDYEKS